MNEKQEQYLEGILKIKREELEKHQHLFKDTNNELSNQIKEISDKWEDVVENHINKKRKLRLIILAEAPLSSDKYFYNSTGTFLNGLKDHYNLNKNSDLPEKMLEEGILLLDIYKLPIPSDYYKSDKENCLFDSTYFKDRLDKINELIGEETRFVFRYSGLFKKRKLHIDPAFSKIYEKLLKDDKGEPIQLFSDEKPQRINKIVLNALR